MSFEEIIKSIIVPLISGMLGGSITSTIILKSKKQKQVNKNNSSGVQVGEFYGTKK